MTADEYLRQLGEARLGAVAGVLETAGYGELPARQLAHRILDAQLQAEAYVIETDLRERT